MRIASVAIIAVALASAVSTAAGTVYRVGPGEDVKSVSAVANTLEPGDIVEVAGDIKDSFVLRRHGTHDAPITIKGVIRTEGQRIVRPVIDVGNRHAPGIICLGDWNVIEGLEITGAKEPLSRTGTAVFVACDNLVMRNCFIRDNFQGLYAEPRAAGNVTLEFCEFARNGAGTSYHSADLGANRPGSRALVQFCVFSDANGGHLLKSHCPRNVVRYNWFENACYSAVQIVDAVTMPGADVKGKDSPLYPMHTDMVGNVFLTGHGPGARYAVLQLGGEQERAPGTEGDFNLSHNLFVVGRGDPAVRGVSILVHGNVDHVRAYNNIFLEYGVRGHTVYERGEVVWETERTRRFRERRGHGEPILQGSNNWISAKAVGIPESFVNTLRGINPHFVDLVNFDFRPAKDSALVGAGMHPLPQGRIVDLAPEYEPRRGIPADLNPTPRRKVTPPSVGPFEPGM